VDNGRLMAHIDDLHARAVRFDQNFVQVVADQREHLRNIQMCESPYKQFCACWHVRLMLIQSGVSSGNRKKRILVTGGAGYIGSTTSLLLLDAGYDVIVVDDLSRGHLDNVDPQRLRALNTLDMDGLTKLLAAEPCDAAIHFAAFIAVGESMKKPEDYFHNNVAGSLSLFTALVRAGVKALVFSSTAAVYGMPSKNPIPEDTPYAAVNPYGESKVMVERILDWFDQIHSFRSVCLRYFNASGAEEKGRVGERHDPETHLIPLLFRAVETGQPVTLFGNDYPTPDGTCIRDYIHVSDLAEAHILAVESLLNGGSSNRFNVGTGTGYSVLDVVRAVEEVTGRKVPHEFGPRRDGDPPALVADSTRLRSTLGWTPRHSDLRTIVDTAWKFHNARKA
jgi:UDP-glucose-4-epimerase GalE